MRLGVGNLASSSTRGPLTRRARAAFAAALLCSAISAVWSAAAAPAAAPTAAAPVVTAITPNNGGASGGTTVTISGSGFAPAATVSFGASAAARVRVDSADTITAVSPAGSPVGTAAVRVGSAGGISAPTARAQFAYDAVPSGLWLGLNGNNSTYLGPVAAFAEHGVAYDRGGPIEWQAGVLAEGGGEPTESGQALDTDIANGMIPVVTIEYRGYPGNYSSDNNFPSDRGGSHTLGEYVSGFVASASSILAAHPGQGILLEPMNEPWGYTTPQFNGAQYADVIAALLPAAAQAGIPASSIYVGASGRHWVSQMYAAQPRLQSEIAGWYLHPYGPPNGSFEEAASGIQSLPHVQAEMTSGQNNLIVSEIGYCAENVNAGKGCGGLDSSSDTKAAENLGAMLVNALAYHDAGWLRALLVYSRNDGGWAMQLGGGALTAQGRVLLSFAEAMQPLAAPLALGAAPLVDGHCLPPLADAIAADGTLFISDGLSCGARSGR